MNTVTETYWLIYAAATVWPCHVGYICIIFSHWINLKLALRFHAVLVVTILSREVNFSVLILVKKHLTTSLAKTPGNKTKCTSNLWVVWLVWNDNCVNKTWGYVAGNRLVRFAVNDTIYWKNLFFDQWGLWEEPLVNLTFRLACSSRLQENAGTPGLK